MLTGLSLAALHLKNRFLLLLSEKIKSGQSFPTRLRLVNCADSPAAPLELEVLEILFQPCGGACQLCCGPPGSRGLLHDGARSPASL